MLTRPTASPPLAATLTGLLTLTLTTPAPAAAQNNGVDCPGVNPVIDGTAVCFAYANGPVTNNGPVQISQPTGNTPIRTLCPRRQNVVDIAGPEEVLCTTDRGWFSRSLDCYLGEPSPDDVPDDETPGYNEHGDDGVPYLASCFPPGDNPYNAGPHWVEGPHGAEPDPDAAQWPHPPTLIVLPEPPDDLEPEQSQLLTLWARAINDLELHGPHITTAPPTDTAGIVNLPVWLWTPTTTHTWPDQPLHTTAQTPTERVDAYARPLHIDWNPGDGTNPTRCHNPGTPWQPGHNLLNPPDCHHIYHQPSHHQPDGTYTITATTTWRIWWHINGSYDNDTTIRVGTTTTYRVNEIQVLTRT